ncbi:MAG: serine acetyltransferase [Deltaproteobacteria bacterium]|nr:serine acetyltransferase [Deltaproteobacteria bacterium]
MFDPTRTSLAAVVDALCQADITTRPERHPACPHRLPSRELLVQVAEDLRTVLFPSYFGTPDLTAESMPFHLGATLDRVSRVLREQIERGIAYGCTADRPTIHRCRTDSVRITQAFLERLPEVKRMLALDVLAAFEGDPAAVTPDEAVFCYPGITAMTNYRLAHELYELEVPLIPRILTEHAHAITGIDIHPGATIGERFFMDHGTGIVIGETARIGKNVRIYQGVTLGAVSFPLDEHGKPVKGIARHPIVEDDVIIYAGATVLGRITVGQGSVIGGNVWLTKALPPGSRVSQSASRRDRPLFCGGAGI